MSDASRAHGTLLQIGDGSGPPENFTTIAEVLDIGGPELGLDTEDVTHHSSPGGWEEHVGTLLRSGQVTFDVNFIPTHATQSASAGLIKDMVDRTVRSFKLIFPDPSTTTWTFSALVARFQPGAAVAGVLRGSVALKITGQPTLA